MTEFNQPYSAIQKICNTVFNFLAAVGFIAFAALLGYGWATYL